MDLDYEDLALAFSALSSATRLELLAQVRYPRAASDIVVKPRRHRPDENPERPVSAPAVREHLNKLADFGLVEAGADGDGRARTVCVINRQRLFALAEAFQQFAKLHGGHAVAENSTLRLNDAPAAAPLAGPRLVLVHGSYEGTAYPLRPLNGQALVLGRRKDAAVALDYDPFVSRDHAVIRRAADGFTIEDSGRSQNGTLVNWTPVAPGDARLLNPGDVVGVGRSRLVFVPE